ncbi:unnamed protein product [Lupinus luteus]|uniref:Uncharacterized protein n=1 Tax=Lupinus luteus TaxID=3873 RepID=A0AAV1Y120_LUPLU
MEGLQHAPNLLVDPLVGVVRISVLGGRSNKVAPIIDAYTLVLNIKNKFISLYNTLLYSGR